MVTDIDTFNPFTAVLLASTGINRYQYEALVGYGKNSEPAPGLADTWETSDDGKTWTFHIPENRKWSDGKPVTADDVVYTYTSIMKTTALQSANGGLVTNIADVKASDPQTVVMTLKSAQAPNPGQEIPIVPKHVWENEDAAKYAADKDVVGSGPFDDHDLQDRPVGRAQGQPALLARQGQGRRHHVRDLQEHRRSAGALMSRPRRRMSGPARCNRRRACRSTAGCTRSRKRSRISAPRSAATARRAFS